MVEVHILAFGIDRMQSAQVPTAPIQTPPRVAVARRFGRCQRGATLIEFAFVIGPFLLMVLGIMTVSLQFFALQSLETGVAVAARKIRTGEAQTAALTVAQFRQEVCDAASWILTCGDSFVLHMKTGSTFADLDPVISCVTNGNMTPTTNVSTNSVADYSGTASSTVLITACYKWTLGNSLWGRLANLTDNSALATGDVVLSATTAFRIEPYN